MVRRPNPETDTRGIHEALQTCLVGQFVGLSLRRISCEAGKRGAACFKGQVGIVQSGPQYYIHMLQPSAALGLVWGSCCFPDTAQESTKYGTRSTKHTSPSTARCRKSGDETENVCNEPRCSKIALASEKLGSKLQGTHRAPV